MANNNPEVLLSTSCLDLVKNTALNKLIASFLPDDDTKDSVMQLITCCNRHGVKTETILEIAKDYTKQEDEGHDH